jgi:serine phosphatase RsbU (regulator of sigma subunit)
LDDEVDAEFLRQKLILVGFSGLGLVDFPTTAIGDRVPGVEIHAQIMETIFDGTTLLRPYWAIWLEAGMIFLIGLVVIFLLPRLQTNYQVALVVVSVGVLVTAGVVTYHQTRLLIDVATPLIFFIALYIAMLGDSVIRDEGQIELLEANLRREREEAAKVQGEMEAAKRFQMGILPQAETTFGDDNRFDIAAIMEPAKMVGGDLYDFFMLDETHVFFSLGDVCGKGVPASLFMVISKTLCKSIALREDADYSQLGQIISQANKEIARDNPEMLFVTAFIGIINLETGEMTYCNAGHERPWLVAANNKPKELIEASGPPIAIMDDIDYKTFKYTLSSEEFICVFTDGITEAMNEHDELYGTDRVLAALDNIRPDDTAQSVLDRLCDDVHDHVGDTEPSDDLTMLVVRWHGKNKS